MDEVEKKTDAKPQKGISKPKQENSSFIKGFVMRALVGLILAWVLNQRIEFVDNMLGEYSPFHKQSVDTAVEKPDKFESEAINRQVVEEDDDEDEDEDEDDLMPPHDDNEGVVQTGNGDQVTAAFINEWNGAVSIFWENDDEEWVLVVPSLRDRTEINTYLGHRFIFAREGTRDQVGDVMEIVPGKFVYTLSKDSKRKAETEDPCSDRFRKRCPEYARDGECDRNPGWMIVHCPKSCNACELLDPKVRCDRKRLNITVEHVWQPGDLNKMFERILSDFPEQKIDVVSRPPDGPWVLVFDDFISSEEADKLIEWGYKLGFERSTDVGEQNERGETTKVVSQHRTSQNTWCMHRCEDDPMVIGVTERTEKITGIPSENYESFQLLKYEKGQYYKVHHDMSPRAKNEASGPRILTFFLYLSDVENGGETHFPRLDLKVKPKKGRAVLWPSVLDEDPWAQDPRTNHAALPVEGDKEVKYGANHWIHSNKYQIIGDVQAAFRNNNKL